MQTNQNIEEKNIVERWEWKDTPWDYRPATKKIYRKLRRKRQKRLLNKAIWDAILKA